MYLGIDIGGTVTKLGLFCGDLNLIAEETIETDSIRHPGTACDILADRVQQFMCYDGASPNRPLAVGVAAPGVFDKQTGLVKQAANLPQWENRNLYADLSHVIGSTVVLVNDASAAALAEFQHRELKETNSLVLLTLGTGIGGGIVIDGRPVTGSHGCGAEVGHMVIDHSVGARSCGCGRVGHLEAYAGARGVVKRTDDQLAAGEASTLHARTLLEPLTPKVIAEEAEAGDPLSQLIIKQTAFYLGVGISQICHVIDPDHVVLGGGMNFGGTKTELGRSFLNDIRQTLRQFSLDQIAESTEVEFSALGNAAGVRGAAIFARSYVNIGTPDGSCVLTP
ncbi:ROK family protein [Stratiformator vulcanicus]|uniref:N-acetyl-D-glucosamine kinase n=1 Tax=Stratiformator vulcanicus TaxID=2527980 RepID=A0A517QYR6_9PLAN|nr:ROK family protein [Stratiformator vulcanicus]QDT36781.1 N-acetyl-D-glucosamine kinase [Stratiformator vulcanicus]